ncbi:LAMI_0G03378g1_1 [Lachancea mirantina]|uniref:LAMI_0G03378g1_1 n=1 Tax=Lachancea mirantina TaxID=1230905 RepID=A0A1G4K8B2_9SACH|nr:LAMI_0G03378g1_1 [Lachancea mirantina]
MICLLEANDFHANSALKRGFQCFQDCLPTNKRSKHESKEERPQPLPEPQAVPHAVPMDHESHSVQSTVDSIASCAASVPYFEIEDYIREGYGSTLINDGYNSRHSLNDIAPVNYSLYDADAEELDEDIEMEMDVDVVPATDRAFCM